MSFQKHKMDKDFEENKISHDTVAITENDSILDFKSPKQLFKKQLTEFSCSNIHQKKKTAVKFNNVVKNHKEVKHKQYLEKRKSLQESQPSIESSFFKVKNNCDDKDFTADVKVALVCPLCFKIFKDLNSRALHMKNCAQKNNIPMKKLLDAIELQKRQEDERKSLGLLAAPVVQDRRKPTSSHRASSCEETDLQLALALSKSLQEAKELDEMNEIQGLPKVLNHFVLEADKSIYEVKKGQLEKFGFANSKPSLLIKNKKKNNKTTLLQTRTEEERYHILTERISEILMANESVTQNQKEEIERNYAIKKKTDIKSHLLQELCNKEKKLWNEAKLLPNRNCFYVPNLSEHITVKKKQEETVLEFANMCNIHDMEVDQYETKSCSNEKIHETSSTELCFVNEEYKNYKNGQFIDKIIKNWGDALNDSSASDIIIFVNNDKHIWAHKLVFYVQCPNILLDVTCNDILLFTKIKEKICWTNIPYNIALAFLEFIYCGIIKKYSNALENLTNISFLRNLARKYKVQELFIFLQKKEVEIKQTKNQMSDKHKQELIFKEEDNLELSSDKIQNAVDDSKSFKLNYEEKLNKKHSQKCVIDKPEFVKIDSNENIHTKKLIRNEINLTNTNVIRNSTVSPDLFDDVNDTINDKEMKNKIKHIDESIDIKRRKNYEDFNMFDSVNEVTIDTVFKNTEENINLLQNTPYFTTPKKENHSNIPKLKSNLSMFIKQFQEENAKSDLDTDSEVSILSTCSKPCRNPFNIRQYNSPEHAISQTNTSAKEAFKVKKDVLDRFDCVTNSKLGTEMIYKKNDTDICIDLESVDNVTQLSESNVGKCIAKYKTHTMNESNAYKEFQDEAIYSATEASLKGHGKGSKNLQNASQYDTDSCTDEDEISMYSKYKKGHENNSIAKYRNFVQEYMLIDGAKDKTTCDEYEEKHNTNMLLLNTDKNSELKISLLKKYDSEMENEKKMYNYKNCKQICQQHSHNFSHECDEHNCPFTNVTSPLSIRKNIPKNTKINNLSKLRHSKSESNMDVQTVRKNSITLVKSNIDKYNSVESPVLVSSSPELDYDILNINKCKEHKSNENILQLEKYEDNSHVFEKEIYLANVCIDNNDDNSNTSSVIKEVNQLDEEIITGKENNKLITTNYFLVKGNEKSLTTKKYNKKFQRKSISETNLRINTQGIKKDVFEFYNNSQCKCDYDRKINLVASPEIIRGSVTPPPNYNDMKISELQAELNKYGLKIQKRKRAVKLLTYIYNELHPIICTTSKNVESEMTVISSEDEEPPMKRINNGKNDVDADVFNYESELALSPINIDIQSPINIIDENKQIDENEFTSVCNNAPHIKDMFLKILTEKRDLYNKILSYEPLCINSLYSMLKTEGIKCKVNALMDFLDEQCITFYVQKTKNKKIN